MDLFNLIASTLASDEKVNAESVEKAAPALTFKRDENGILWSYDADGNKVGRIFEHGEDDRIDKIKEI